MNERTDYSFRLTIVVDEQLEGAIYQFYKDQYELDVDVPVDDFVLGYHTEIDFFSNDKLIDHLQDIELEGKEDTYGIRAMLAERLDFGEHDFFVISEITYGMCGCIMQVGGSFTWQ